MAKTLTGIVTSDSVDKTIVVTVSNKKTHPLYKKKYMTSKKFMAHDEKNEAKIGDKVLLTETKPLSARKRHMLTKVLERAAITADKTVDAIVREEQAGANEHPIKKEKDEEVVDTPAVEVEKPAKKVKK